MTDEKVRQKHKHYDCIVAWAEGKPIELYNIHTEEWYLCNDPSWVTTFQYRIKPEPKSYNSCA